jgi:glycosyltransferase involved in cell wall biosynthesis
MKQVTLVVPCYNEAARLDDQALLSLVDDVADLSLILVNDGSTDATEARLTALSQASGGRIHCFNLPENRGKAEAVRQGLLRALDGPAAVVGYFDADLSTPPSELARLIAVIRESGASAVLGSRVSRLGSAIERGVLRHYLGRIFASAASLLLRANVYDTQCGAKLFQRNPTLQAALEEPFLSRWAFDVELLGRLLTGTNVVPALPARVFVEVPLLAWKDVPGSKLTGRAMARAARDLARIGITLRRRRKAADAAALAGK